MVRTFAPTDPFVWTVRILKAARHDAEVIAGMLSHAVINHRLYGIISVGERNWRRRGQDEWRIREVSSVLIENPFDALFPLR